MKKRILSVMLVLCLLFAINVFSAQALTSYFTEQSGYDTPLYLITDPQGAAQDFSPDFSSLAAVQIYMQVTGGGTVTLEVREKAAESATALASVNQQITAGGTGWQTFFFAAPVAVEAGKTYAIFVTATNRAVVFGKSGSFGTTGYHAYNDDPAAYGGWVTETANFAFKAISAETTVSQVTKAISALPVSITLAEEDAVHLARVAYDALPAAQRDQVTNYSVLTAAEATIAALRLDIREQRIRETEDSISAIGTVTLDSRNAIVTAMNLLNKLIDTYGNDITVKGTDILMQDAAQYQELLHFTLGDVNQDGTINTTDALVTLRAAVSHTKMSQPAQCAADVSPDDLINTTDSLLILRRAVGKITSFEKAEEREEKRLITERNRELFTKTYQSMLDRILDGGYASTSLTGAYTGMFVRDTSIQIMAHVEAGDWQAAERLLRYTLSYHLACNAAYPLHVMSPLAGNIQGDSFIPSDFTAQPSQELTRLGGTAVARQDILPSADPTTAVELYLARTAEAANAEVSVTLLRGGTRIDTAVLPASDIPLAGGWVRAAFCLPLLSGLTGNYSVEISAASAPENTVICYGSSVPAENRAAVKTNGTEQTLLNGMLAYRAYGSEIKPISTMKQADTAYMLAHAWMLYINHAPESREKEVFAAQSYPIVAALADYFPENGFLHDNNLLRNPNLEHSRDVRYWDAYDLITNCFASQAFYELSQYKMSTVQDASRRLAYAKTIEKGINEHLTTEIDGKKCYAELIAIDEGGKFYPGFSWVNWAPVAADWYGTDETVMENTYQAYLKYGSLLYYKKWQMLEVVSTYNGSPLLTRNGNHVIGKGLAWEILYCRKTAKFERLEELVDFVESNSPNGMYMETWGYTGGGSDTANQEHASWMLYAMHKALGITSK